MCGAAAIACAWALSSSEHSPHDGEHPHDDQARPLRPAVVAASAVITLFVVMGQFGHDGSVDDAKPVPRPTPAAPATPPPRQSPATTAPTVMPSAAGAPLCIGPPVPPTPQETLHGAEALLAEAWRLHAAHRSFAAATKLREAEAAILARDASADAAARSLEQHSALAAEVRSRAAAAAAVMEEMDGETEWMGQVEAFGSLTRYRYEGGAASGAPGSVIVRVDGLVDGSSLTDLLSCWKEADLYTEWLPSCSHSKQLALDLRCEMIIHLGISVLAGMIARDGVIHGYAVDALAEHGQILILAKDATAATHPHLAHLLPPPGAGGVARMSYKKVVAKLQPAAGGGVNASLVMCIDFGLGSAPAALRDRIIRLTAVVFFYNWKRCAARIEKSGRTSRHARAIEGDPTFYRGWLEVILRENEERMRAGDGRASTDSYS